MLSPLDSAIICFYFLILIIVGLVFGIKNTSTEDYFLGSRKFRGWVLGISLVGTSISSITFLAYPGDAFKTAWLRFLPNLMLPIAILVAARFFLPRLRKGKAITAYEFLESRFGSSVRIYGAVSFIVAQFIRLSLILYLVGLVLQQIIGFSANECIVLAGIAVALYTVLGGINAVIWTDVIQTTVLLLGGLICMFVIVQSLPGGFSQIIEVGMIHGKLAFAELRDGQLIPVSWGPSLSEKTITMMLLIGLISWLTEYSSNQNTVQRFNAASSAAEARKAMYICAAVSLPTWGFFMLLGTALYVFFDSFPATPATEMLMGIRKAEEVLPYFITQHLPTGIIGLVLAAIVAAAMSSLDSSINSISTVATSDIYRRFLNKGASDPHYLKFARLTAFGTGVLMIVGAIILSNANTKTIQDTAMVLTSLLAGGLLSIYIVGFFANRGDEKHVMFGILGTMMFTAWTLLSSKALLPEVLLYPFDLYYTGLIGNIVMFVFIYGISLNFLPKKIQPNREP